MEPMLAEFSEEAARRASVILGLPFDFLKKDHYITKAICVLTRVENEYFSLVFQGGTSLSKAYQIISRLSEDVDFRVSASPHTLVLGKVRQRKLLRDYRHQLIAALRGSGFTVDSDVKVFYEGRYMRVNAHFENQAADTYLRPHIAIECFVGKLALSPVTRYVATLTDETLGTKSDENSFSVECVALDETAAEKWVALTRRAANIAQRQRPEDKHLIRHLYDLYKLQCSNILSGDYRQIIPCIIEKDREQFKHVNQGYTENPIKTSKAAIHDLLTAPQWRAHWDDFIAQMVYETSSPNFEDACASIEQMSSFLFNRTDINT